MSQWSLPALAFALASFAAPVPAAHPDVLFGAADVPLLRAKRSQYPQAYENIRRVAQNHWGSRVARSGEVTLANGSAYQTGDRRSIGDMLLMFAFVAALESDERYFDLARDWLNEVVGWRELDLDGQQDLILAHLLAAVSLAYDMLAPRLDSGREIVEVISRNADLLMDPQPPRDWWLRSFLQNHNWINHAAIGFAALATRGEVDAAMTARWLSKASTNAADVETLLDPIVDGTWHEGLSYLAYGLGWHLPFVTALARVGETDYGDLGLIRGYGAMRAHVQLPERPNHYLIMNGDFSHFSKVDELPLLRYAAARHRDPVAQAAADRWIAGAPPTTWAPSLLPRVFEFLFYDPSVPSADLSAESLDWYGADQQSVVFRSGWGAGATLFGLKSGAFGGLSGWRWQETGAEPAGRLNLGHDHADDNGFYFYGNGSWLAPEAPGYYIGHPNSPPPQANRAIFHNVILVDGEGQAGEGVREHGDDLDDYPWFPSRRGGILEHGSTAHFAYAVADGSFLYPASANLSLWHRQALFVDRRWVVLRDALRSPTPRRYTWLCHFMNGGAREGDSRWLRGEGENGQLLGVAVVSPASFEVSFESQRPVHVEDFNPAGSVTLARVQAPEAAATTFLTALIPSSAADWEQRPVVDPIDPLQPDAGVRIRAGGGRSLAVFNDEPDSERRVGSFSLLGSAAVVAYNADGVPNRVALIDARRFADAARVLASTDEEGPALEADGLERADLAISSSGAGPVRLYAPAAVRVTWNGAPTSFRREGDFVVVPDAADLIFRDGFDPR